MNFIRNKLMKMMLTALVLSGASAFCAYGGMNLDADAAVSGIAVALNNYYARMQHPQEALVESLLTAANDNVLVIADDVEEKKNEGSEAADATDGETGERIIYYTDENGVLHQETVTASLSATEKLLQEVEDKGPEVEITTDGSTVGTVYGTATLRLRQKPDADSKTLTLLALGEQYTVIGYENEFYKIQVDDDLVGYVFKDYIQTSKKTPEQIASEKRAREEEAARLKKEAERALAEYEEARRKAALESEKAAEAASIAEQQSAAQAASEAQSRAEETRVEAFESFSGSETREEPDKTAEAQVETPPQTVEVYSSQAAEASATVEKTTQAQTTQQTAQTTQAQTTQATANVPAGPGVAALTSAQRTAIVAYAKQFLGGKYVYGGTSLTDGVDCSGFVMRVYEYFGYDIGRTSRDQAAGGRSISTSELQPGDLIFYANGNTINHVAMYIGNGEVIHASNATNGIIISKYNYRTPCRMCSFLD